MHFALVDRFGRPETDVCIPEGAVIVGFGAVVIIRTEWEDVDRINSSIGERCNGGSTVPQKLGGEDYMECTTLMGAIPCRVPV